MIPGKSSGKDPSYRPFRAGCGTQRPTRVARLSSLGITRKGISIPVLQVASY
jgi:hypothetical protein